MLIGQSSIAANGLQPFDVLVLLAQNCLLLQI